MSDCGSESIAFYNTIQQNNNQTDEEKSIQSNALFDYNDGS